MKKLSVILSCILIASVFFALPVSSAGNEPKNDYDVSKTFGEKYDLIKINVACSHLTVKISPDNTTRISYKNNNPDRVEFKTEIKDNTLIVEEKIKKNTNNRNLKISEINVEIPKAVYKKINLDTISGTVIADVPETENLYVNTISGIITLNYKGNNNPDYLKNTTVSGNVTVNNFSPKKFDISLTSGILNVNGLSGSGSLKVVSGTANLDYKKWDSALSVKVVSGNANIKVPAGSGADLTLSRISGSVQYDMNGVSGKLSKSGSVVIKGTNMQTVKANITNGNISIKTK
ncbi:MAG: DUF4097 domain-containing protein [Oscillospiraceae bacterium]|nr:DUF4097 domain-containing protein [Oscillospiraceae bacterium]